MQKVVRIHVLVLFSCLVLILFLGACSTSRQVKPTFQHPTIDSNHEKEVENEFKGIASWYGRKFHKRRTASGERYNMYAFTAAHRTLPFGTKIRVKSLESGKTVIVRINDRGPYKKNRVIDLSYSAFRALGYSKKGLASVELERI